MESRSPLQLGERAPDFTLPAVGQEGTVSLSDYRNKSPLLLALFRGLWCPFCRRTIAQLGSLREKLQAAGIETLGIVATKPEHASLYFRFHPTRLPLVADPGLITHRSYGLPKPPVTPELMQAVQSVRINPSGELPEALPIPEAVQALDRLDNFKRSATDQQDSQQQLTQLKGQFLLDRDSIVRWVNIECGKEGLEGLGKFPSDEDFMAAAQTLAA
ncbi:MAG: redoxin domain-containing protein [Deltaproteobacteria bacterium]|nr:redoxin domain-containing protein [Deltaproteobacteria bacterium]